MTNPNESVMDGLKSNIEQARAVIERCGEVALAIEGDDGIFEYGIHVTPKGRWSVSFVEDEVVWDAEASEPSQHPSDFDGCIRLIASHVGARMGVQLTPSPASPNVIGWV